MKIQFRSRGQCLSGWPPYWNSGRLVDLEVEHSGGEPSELSSDPKVYAVYGISYWNFLFVFFHHYVLFWFCWAVKAAKIQVTQFCVWTITEARSVNTGSGFSQKVWFHSVRFLSCCHGNNHISCQLRNQIFMPFQVFCHL